MSQNVHTGARLSTTTADPIIEFNAWLEAALATVLEEIVHATLAHAAPGGFGDNVCLLICELAPNHE
jgi:pyridoxine/pyridoxamine 5'-phosphate oxidase